MIIYMNTANGGRIYRNTMPPTCGNNRITRAILLFFTAMRSQSMIILNVFGDNGTAATVECHRGGGGGCDC